MPPEELPPDPEALKMWRNLPHNKPSRQALPPVMGGSRLVAGLLVMMLILSLIALLAQAAPP
jgi:hypothetical protein